MAQPGPEAEHPSLCGPQTQPGKTLGAGAGAGGVSPAGGVRWSEGRLALQLCLPLPCGGAPFRGFRGGWESGD